MTRLEPSEPPRPPPASDRDAIMGPAIKRTLAVILLVGLAVAGLSFLVETGPPAPGPGVLTDDQPEIPAALIPEVRFTEVTAAAGIGFVHTNGAYGDKLLPETMAGGVAFVDVDNDLDLDLVFINSTYWPWQTPPGVSPPTHALYLNDGQGQFTDATAGSGLDFSCYGMGVAAGDYDNDGRVDLFISAVGECFLLRNEGGGRFRDVTAESGIAVSSEDWGTSCAWFDYDNDGDLDLFLCNYLRWSREIDYKADYQLAGIGRAYGQPWNFPSTFPALFRNDGNGRFTDVSAASGIQIVNQATGLPLAKSLGVTPTDFDDDGWIDLVVANDTVRNFVFHNQRNGTFREIGATSGLAYDSFGGTRGCMGIDSARFQEDNSLGISIGNFANEMTALYVSQGKSPLFTDEAIARGIGQATRYSLTFGVFFFDFDLDGWLDLLTANGHIENEINKIQPSQHYRQSAQLFWNTHSRRPGAGFAVVPPAKSGPDLVQPIVGRGSAYADIDGDGDLDVVIAQINGPPLLLRNDQATGHHWLRFKLTGTTSNRDAIGAWVRVQTPIRTMWRQVMPTRGYLSQSELPVTFGLGNRARVDDVTVFWPDGTRQRVPNPVIDGLTRVTQGK